MSNKQDSLCMFINSLETNKSVSRKTMKLANCSIRTLLQILLHSSGQRDFNRIWLFSQHEFC